MDHPSSQPAAREDRLTLSVLMSTYARETGLNLAASLASIRDQTRLPDQVVLVLDGPIGQDQEDVIEDFAASLGSCEFTLLRLPENVGLAHALNSGLAVCTGHYTARMDSDDICEPDRLQIQCEYAVRHPEIDMICSWNDEFFDNAGPSRLKVAPVNHGSLVQALHWRNVIQHSTVFAKTEVLRAVGGYSSKYGLLEDYDLFIRLALYGARFHSIPKILVHIRCSLDQRKRRGGFRYCLHEMRFRYDYFRAGFLSAGEFMIVTFLYTVFRLISGSLRGRLYALTRT